MSTTYQTFSDFLVENESVAASGPETAMNRCVALLKCNPSALSAASEGGLFKDLRDQQDSRTALLLGIASNYLLGRFDIAIDYSARFARQYGASLYACVLLFSSLMMGGRDDVAAEILQKTAEIGDGEKLIFNLLRSCILMRAHKIEAANVFLHQAVQSGPSAQVFGVASEELRSALEQAIREKTVYKETQFDVYDAEGTLRHYKNYKNAYETMPPFSNEVTIAGEFFFSDIAAMLTENPTIDAVINFGVLCAYNDHKLARRFPNVRFVCIDRDPLVKQLNEEAYHAPNIEYVADDALSYIRGGNITGVQSGLLVHCKTATLVFPEYLHQLYSEARGHGVRHIYGLEHYCFRRDRLEWPDLEANDFVSCVSREPMLVHNYPAIHRASGFAMKSFVRRPVMWLDAVIPQFDFHYLAMRSSRPEG